MYAAQAPRLARYASGYYVDFSKPWAEIDFANVPLD